MAASVGSVDCTFVKGSAGVPRQRVMSWYAPGTDGMSALLLGANEAEFSFTAIVYDSLTQVEAWYVSLQGLQGTLAMITDDWGTIWSNCLIVDVSLLRRTPALGSGVTDVDTRGEVTIRGVVAAPP